MSLPPYPANNSASRTNFDKTQVDRTFQNPEQNIDNAIDAFSISPQLMLYPILLHCAKPFPFLETYPDKQ